MILVEIDNMPSLLRSIVRSALESQGDFDIVDAPADEAGEAPARVDVVIVSADRAKLGHISLAALVGADSPRVVTLSADGHSASILRLTAENSRIEATSDLSKVVRQAALERRRAIH